MAELTHQQKVELLRAQLPPNTFGALSRFPLDTKVALSNRAACYLELERYVEAFWDAEFAVHLAPDWPRGWYRRGRALEGLKRYKEAVESYERCFLFDDIKETPDARKRVSELK